MPQLFTLLWPSPFCAPSAAPPRLPPARGALA